ncbi:MAG: Rho termination factor N-terminal domain-containing protein [Clostridium sp.]
MEKLEQSYEDMTVADLKKVAINKGINITSNIKKSEIIEFIIKSGV